MIRNRRTLRHARQLRLARLGRGVGHRRRFKTVTELAASRIEALRRSSGDDMVTRPELASSEVAVGAGGDESGGSAG